MTNPRFVQEEFQTAFSRVFLNTTSYRNKQKDELGEHIFTITIDIFFLFPTNRKRA